MNNNNYITGDWSDINYFNLTSYHKKKGKNIINKLLILFISFIFLAIFTQTAIAESLLAAYEYVNFDLGEIQNVGFTGGDFQPTVGFGDSETFPPGVTTGNTLDGADLLPPAGIDWTDGGSAPMVKPATVDIPGVSDMVSIWSQMWNFDTDNIAWVFLAMLLCVFFFWLFTWQLDHVGYAMLIVGVIIGFFSIPTINVIPWGGLFIAALAIIAGTVVEVKA